MIAVLFEAIVAPGQRDDYFTIAASLKPELSKIDGFISIERFQSLSDPQKFLSLSFWRDEESITEWRSIELHRAAQVKGRVSIFSDYRLRVVSVIRDYGMHEREEAPKDSKVFHDLK